MAECADADFETAEKPTEAMLCTGDGGEHGHAAEGGEHERQALLDVQEANVGFVGAS